MSADRPAWHADWDPLVARIGEDLFTLPEHRGWGSPRGDVVWGADPIEASALRRWLEPLEFDSPLHHDLACARAEGYDNLVVPLTALISFCLPTIWVPGGPSAFTSDDRDAQPSTGQGDSFAGFPAPEGYTGYFGTDFEFSVIRPALVGDWIGRHGSRLVEVLPKETGAGQGAFLRWEVEFVTKAMEPIASYRVQMFSYRPRAGDAA